MTFPTRSSWRAPSTSTLTSPEATKHGSPGIARAAHLFCDGSDPGHFPRPAGTWNTFETGCAYAAMGFTTVVEPAVSPHHALQAHLELADIPIIDKATLTVLGNDDFLLESAAPARRQRRDPGLCSLDPLHISRALGIKVINAGGAAAFKDNVRAFSLDDEVPSTAFLHAQSSRRSNTQCTNFGCPPAARPLQQSWPRRQCRDRTGDNRGGGKPSAPSRTPAVLWLRQGRSSRLLFGRCAPGRSSERRQVRHYRRWSGDVRTDRHDFM